MKWLKTETVAENGSFDLEIPETENIRGIAFDMNNVTANTSTVVATERGQDQLMTTITAINARGDTLLNLQDTTMLRLINYVLEGQALYSKNSTASGAQTAHTKAHLPLIALHAGQSKEIFGNWSGRANGKISINGRFADFSVLAQTGDVTLTSGTLKFSAESARDDFVNFSPTQLLEIGKQTNQTSINSRLPQMDYPRYVLIAIRAYSGKTVEDYINSDIVIRNVNGTELVRLPYTTVKGLMAQRFGVKGTSEDTDEGFYLIELDPDFSGIIPGKGKNPSVWTRLDAADISFTTSAAADVQIALLGHRLLGK